MRRMLTILIAVILLIPVIRRETKKYLQNLDAKSEDEIPTVDRQGRSLGA